MQISNHVLVESTNLLIDNFAMTNYNLIANLRRLNYFKMFL